MLDPSWYKDREQTYVKHFVLEKYLQKFTYKLGSVGGTLNYVDCFAGPWQHTSEDLEDTSPFIAIRELRAALEALRGRLRDKGRPPLRIRCLFIEENRERWSLLSEKLRTVQDIEVQALNGEFEDYIDAIRNFAGNSFTFFFIDPTGWTGYPLRTIEPLLRLPKCEVLINFMTQFVSRFVDSDKPKDRESFRLLFGSEDYREQWSGLSGLDREDAIVSVYGRRVKEAGSFQFVAPSIVLDPVDDRSLFHLIYATRHIEGLRAFRNDAERPASRIQAESRWQARERRQSPGQALLFEEPASLGYSESLQRRYHGQAQDRLMTMLRAERRVGFDRLEEEALLFPLMNEQSLKAWLNQLKAEGIVEFGGLGPRKRALKPGRGHFVVMTEKGRG